MSYQRRCTWTADAFYIHNAMHAARSDGITLHQYCSRIVMHLEAVVATCPLDRVVDEVHPICTLCEIIKVQLVRVTAIIGANYRPIVVVGAWPAVVDIEILNCDPRHAT